MKEPPIPQTIRGYKALIALLPFILLLLLWTVGHGMNILGELLLDLGEDMESSADVGLDWLIKKLGWDE